MPHRSLKMFENPFHLSVRLMVLATVIVGGLAAVALASAVARYGVVEYASPAPKTNEGVDHHYNGRSLDKKQGPYVYGQSAPYRNVTFTPATLTITLKTTNVTTETIIPPVAIANSTTGTDYRPSLTGFTPKPTATIHVIPFATIHAHTATDSLNYTLTSSTVDAQTNSMISGNTIRSSAMMSNDTANSSVFKCTRTPTPVELSSTTQVPEFITAPRITVTTTVLYSVSDDEEYTSTETVTVTPHVTVLRGTTITLPSAAATKTISSTVTQTDSSLGIVTVTVYLSQVLTQAQTGAVGISISNAHVTGPEPVTATLLQTVSPVPSSSSMKTCTESDMTTYGSVVPVVSILPTLTVTISDETISFSTDTSIPTEVSAATTTVTLEVAATGVSVDTTCTTSTASIDSTTTHGSPPASHVPSLVSDSSHPSIRHPNNTSVITMGTFITSSTHVTAQSITRYTTFTHKPGVNHTSSGVTTYPANTSIPVTSGAGPDEKPPCSAPWGGNDGGGSRSCVVMLAVVISLGLQGLM